MSDNSVNTRGNGIVGTFRVTPEMGMSTTLLKELQRPSLSRTDVESARAWVKQQKDLPHAQVAQDILQHIEKRFENQGTWESVKELARDAVKSPVATVLAAESASFEAIRNIR